MSKAKVLEHFPDAHATNENGGRWMIWSNVPGKGLTVIGENGSATGAWRDAASHLTPADAGTNDDTKVRIGDAEMTTDIANAFGLTPDLVNYNPAPASSPAPRATKLAAQAIVTRPVPFTFSPEFERLRRAHTYGRTRTLASDRWSVS